MNETKEGITPFDLIVNTVATALRDLISRKYTGRVYFEFNFSQGGVGPSYMGTHTKIKTPKDFDKKGESKPQ